MKEELTMIRLKDKCKCCGKFLIPEDARALVEAKAPQRICRCDEADGVLVLEKPKALSWGTEITLFIGLSLVLSPIGWGLIRGIMWLIHKHNNKVIA